MKMNIKWYAMMLISSAMALTSLTAQTISTKDITGAWGYGSKENRTVMINTDKVFSVAKYDVTGKKFIGCYGGTWRIDGNKIIKNIEWNSTDSQQVGKEISEPVQLTGGKLIITPNNETWDRLDDGKPGALMGAWIITGTYSNDKVTKRTNPFFPRRTMKVLSGKYFHWIAYNVATKTFLSTGGGTYTTADGKYTENIEFFTKTAESVGKTLVFDYSFVDGDWRHKGQKSTGGSMDESWSKRETLEK
jgi:hypothetical protein